MKNKAIIQAHPDSGLVVTEGESKAGNKYGKFVVKETQMVVNEQGFMAAQTRAAFITIGEDQLELAKASLKAGDAVPFAGRIQRIETREPQYEGHKAKINPTTNEDYLLDGALVYFQDKWNPDANCEDTLLSSEVSGIEAEAAESSEAQA